MCCRTTHTRADAKNSVPMMTTAAPMTAWNVDSATAHDGTLSPTSLNEASWSLANPGGHPSAFIFVVTFSKKLSAAEK